MLLLLGGFLLPAALLSRFEAINTQA